MTVGKGSRAKANKAADTGEAASNSEAAAINSGVAKMGTAIENPSIGKKTTARKRTSKKAAVIASVQQETMTETATVITNIQQETLEKIMVQQDVQIPDRVAEEKENIQIGEAMPIYYY
ncbi:MAG: hypothetical protein IKM28_08960 [Lachnospiraceae bacterium]|nr:hypothetical protein [Lachnospiraceae bacterium]